ncbi:MAG: hypothetical protein Q7T83_11545 [Thermodesulfovibrionales bacterium]|nr:hypothetical protein [Thermodesulfovibrionales bacterium]MDP3112704.1 hypothetical protein [Thermodesulfovibrionales bacterium]
MKKITIYVGAFIVGLIFIGLGFYLVPVYQHPLSRHIIWGPLSVFLAYFIFGLPPVTIYFRYALNDRWTRALLKGTGIVVTNVIVLGSLTFIVMRAIGKI